MGKTESGLMIRRALLSVSDKEGIEELGKALSAAGVELIATGRTAQRLIEAGLKVIPIEEVSGSPEAFQGRMKTLSSPVCSGILYRRGNTEDERDLRKLQISPIDCVVVNFYPFEEAAAKANISRSELIEQVDIGGPTLVRAAAKNAPDVLVLTSPHQYSQVIEELRSKGSVSASTVQACAAAAWDEVLKYDAVIARELGGSKKRVLRYGENPHQKAFLEIDPEGPIAWDEKLTPHELSYNNILDLSAAYALASDLNSAFPECTGVVIVKHNNPCGVAWVPKNQADAQKLALTRAWEGDPVSAFGGVVIFTDPIEQDSANWLSQYFVELISAPGLSSESEVLQTLLKKRKNLKAVALKSLQEMPSELMTVVPGGRIYQTPDIGVNEELRSATQKKWPEEKTDLARFGIAVGKALKSNAIALVRELHSAKGAFQLVGAGQGQPNRIDALKGLAIPRAESVLRGSEGDLSDCVMVSDAFFPFRDTVDAAHAAGIRWIIQPGGSVRDAESILACDEHGIAMALTGTRHFKH